MTDISREIDRMARAIEDIERTLDRMDRRLDDIEEGLSDTVTTLRALEIELETLSNKIEYS